MVQDNAAKADELLALGRELFGDEWADNLAVTASENVSFSYDGFLRVCGMCGCYAADQDKHRDYHRLLTIGIHFAGSVTTAHWARCEVGDDDDRAAALRRALEDAQPEPAGG